MDCVPANSTAPHHCHPPDGCVVVPGEAQCFGPLEVALKRANTWGVHDMLGNVAEWTWDRDAWDRDDYDFFGDTVDPLGPSPQPTGELTERVVRGGTFGYTAWETHFAVRTAASPERGDFFIGFRVARTVQQCDPTAD